jgi:hypothetical protein
MFLCRLGARRQIALRMDTQGAARLFKSVFGVLKIPHGDTINELFKALNLPAVEEILFRIVEILIDRKVLYPWRLLGLYYLVALDATGTVTFTKRHCSHCLTKTHNGKTLYYHNVLQASIVTSSGMAFPVMSEFIENPEDIEGDTEEKRKQDCEIKAFYRLAPRLAKRFPHLPLAVLIDGLYAAGPVFSLCERYRWKFIVNLPDDKLPGVTEEFHALAKMKSANAITLDTGNNDAIHQEFAWANAIEYRDSKGGVHTLDVLQCKETKPESDGPITFRWATNFAVDKDNAPRLANNGARLRWKTENEVFNVQKNGGFALEHAYTGDPNAAKIFYCLLQIAFILHQLVERGSLFRNAFPKGFGSAKNLAAEVLEAVRRVGVTVENWARILETRIQIRFETVPPAHTIAGQIYIPALSSA